MSKLATMPAFRVTDELRRAAEASLAEGEPMSAFLEEAVRRNIDLRAAQQAFVDRGLRARAQAKKTGSYLTAAQVLARLDARLARARRRSKR
jgi:predicted transcriptional regulator